MSSGFGFKGTANRCYVMWKEVERCNREADLPGSCAAQVEDYLECLHHKKELSRMNAMVVQQEREAKGIAASDGHHH
ncbi:hypothetical protein THRCLA_22523 [Thraustotheca clavata]|uniref:NADH dehydrogenase [ubiquinone] iron-sulfur protein 5 n=1 Tax=Thraustotheca clavata TaxID=74557 RepID=A0A1V9YYR2_9STRA|nr:hypothetical protein THRCLA_22523 [Thraustotheca clavata]